MAAIPLTLINSLKRPASTITSSSSSSRYLSNGEKRVALSQPAPAAQPKEEKILQETLKHNDIEFTSSPDSLSLLDSSAFFSRVRIRLRLLGEPIALFAESREAALERLKNKLMKLSERDAAGAQNGARTSSDSDPIPVLIRSPPSDYLSLDPAAFETKQKYLLEFFKVWLKGWADKLARGENMTGAEKHKQGVLLRQSEENLKPFFSELKRGQAEAAVVDKGAAICDAMRAGDFKRANEVYMELAIGNAAWPMGVTMVGIHERSGREKIAASSATTSIVGHVLNDEKMRKVIQTIKRCITFTQDRKEQEEREGK